MSRRLRYGEGLIRWEHGRVTLLEASGLRRRI